MSINFNKDNIDKYLNALAVECKKLGCKQEIEIILVGGATILINYGFRLMSNDIDAFYKDKSIIKQASITVRDKYNLPINWLNDDFTKTNSFSDKIIQYSTYYKTFNHIINVRVIKDEYLIAMKLASGRRYKKDLSDIAGIILENRNKSNPITYEIIDKAVCNLYGDWSRISNYSKDTLIEILSSNNLKQVFDELNNYENTNKEELIKLERKNPKAINESNINEIIDQINKRQ